METIKKLPVPKDELKELIIKGFKDGFKKTYLMIFYKGYNIGYNEGYKNGIQAYLKDMPKPILIKEMKDRYELLDLPQILESQNLSLDYSIPRILFELENTKTYNTPFLISKLAYKKGKLLGQSHAETIGYNNGLDCGKHIGYYEGYQDAIKIKNK